VLAGNLQKLSLCSELSGAALTQELAGLTGFVRTAIYFSNQHRSTDARPLFILILIRGASLHKFQIICGDIAVPTFVSCCAI
jgi:hypothetical protein